MSSICSSGAEPLASAPFTTSKLDQQLHQLQQTKQHTIADAAACSHQQQQLQAAWLRLRCWALAWRLLQQQATTLAKGCRRRQPATCHSSTWHAARCVRLVYFSQYLASGFVVFVGVLFGSSGGAVVCLHAVCFLLRLRLALAAAAAGNEVGGCGILSYLAADGSCLAAVVFGSSSSCAVSCSCSQLHLTRSEVCGWDVVLVL